MSSHGPEIPLWVKADGPDADVVITTRARLARDLAGFPFPARADDQSLTIVATEVRRACARLGEHIPGLRALRVEKLTAEQRTYLLDAHVASVEQVRGGVGRVVIADAGGRLSIMVNEEDHLRLQSLESGLAPEKAWNLVDWADDVLAQELDYGFSDKLGYLTASVSNVGTGLRVSALMHLGGLAMTGSLSSVLRAAWDLGVSVRGLFGEGSQGAGDLYQVSNEVTLGFSERDIVQKVRSVAEYLLGAERLARKELLDTQRSRLVDSAARSLRTMQGAMSLRARDLFVLMSPVRLAVSLEVAEDCSVEVMNEMLMLARGGAGDDMSVRLQRAAASRRKMAGVSIAPV